MQWSLPGVSESPRVVFGGLLRAPVLSRAAAIKLLDKILENKPDDAHSHLKLVEIYSAPAFREDQKLAANARAYIKGCPSSRSVYSYIT
jgi:hypothetical protein